MNSIIEILDNSYNPYRFGFNGKEKNDELKGEGNSYDFGARIYDSRIARFLSIDTKWKAFTALSPYIYTMNNPIRFIDIDGEGPGDGIRRLYVTMVEVPTKDGVQTVYLKKVYYENATPNQVAVYERASKTPNGWYLSTQAEYDQFQKDPDQGAFKSTMYGADTPQKHRELGGVIGSVFGQPVELKGARTGVLSVETSGQDLNGNIITETFTLSVFDNNGKLVSSQSEDITGGGTAEFDYDLQGKQYVVVSRSQGNNGASSYRTGIYTPFKKGEQREDNMSDYGDEEPMDEDIEAVGKIIDKQK